MDTLSIVEEKKIIRGKVAVPMLWVSIVAICMFFAAFTSAYVVSREKGDWLHFELPQLFYISTAIIIISSVTMNWAWTAAKKENFATIKIASFITLLLGIGFIIFQVLGWRELYQQKIVFAGKYSNASGSYLYVITCMHILHLVGGLFALIVVFTKSLGNKYNSQNLLGIKLCAIYWHFLDVLWIYLFLFLLFVR